MIKSIPNFSVSVYAERHRDLRRVVRKACADGLVEVSSVGGLFYVKGKMTMDVQIFEGMPDEYIERNVLRNLQNRIHEGNKAVGWWDNPREIGTLLCLVHSEISEAMEGARKNLMDDHLPHRPMLEVELADAVIRILDLAGGYNLDLTGAIQEKLEYNAQRADHKRDARQGENGKLF